MLISMTGYGNGTCTRDGITAHAEIRSVNNRFFEFSARLPKYLQPRENELKEQVRAEINRGKVALNISIEKTAAGDSPITVNYEAARTYYNLLTALRDSIGLKEEIPLATLLSFSDVFVGEEQPELDPSEWDTVREAVNSAVSMLVSMKRSEGSVLTTDLHQRVRNMENAVLRVEELSHGRSNLERAKLRERVEQILASDRIDPQRLELEIVLLADKMDITEEIVRFRSHVIFFHDALDSADSEGRKLSFLLQEMNREANTIASKAYDADIAHLVVGLKEELERIREQLQNIE